MIKDIARSLTGIAAAAMALSLSGCNAASGSAEGMKGVPLADLDLSGPPPEEIALLGPDTVTVLEGDRLAIQVEGNQDVKDRLRFVLQDGKLAIGRDGWKIGTVGDYATIEVTVPTVRRLVMAGSGAIRAAALHGEAASVSIAGSGNVEVPVIDTGELKIEVMGSGSLKAAGKARSLNLIIAGSGAADLSGLTAEQAKVDIAGSGKASFGSDGEVSASIMGSGEVRVKGRAACRVTAVGSGRLICEP